MRNSSVSTQSLNNLISYPQPLLMCHSFAQKRRRGNRVIHRSSPAAAHLAPPPLDEPTMCVSNETGAIERRPARVEDTNKRPIAEAIDCDTGNHTFQLNNDTNRWTISGAVGRISAQ